MRTGKIIKSEVGINRLVNEQRKCVSPEAKMSKIHFIGSVHTQPSGFSCSECSRSRLLRNLLCILTVIEAGNFTQFKIPILERSMDPDAYVKANSQNAPYFQANIENKTDSFLGLCLPRQSFYFILRRQP